MTLGKVVGTVVATMKIKDLEGYKLLVVQPIDPQGNPKGRSSIALDTVQAGVGDIVMLIDEGNSSRQILEKPQAAVRTTIFAIVDQIHTGGGA
jgi:ethanolamine utilization protein EutN